MKTKKSMNELYYWDYSAISGDTAYFYFTAPDDYKDFVEVEDDNVLLCVEYWVDEDKVAKVASWCTKEGDMIEESEFYALSDEQMSKYREICKKKIAEA